jgi:hypothetical protein
VRTPAAPKVSAIFILALLFFPLLKPFARLLVRLLPTRVDAADPSQPVYLCAFRCNVITITGTNDHVPPEPMITFHRNP